MKSFIKNMEQEESICSDIKSLTPELFCSMLSDIYLQKVTV